MTEYKQWLKVSLKGRTIYTQKHLNVQKYNFGALDEGPGVRHAVFLQGCPNFCPGCRNVEAKRLQLNKLISPQKVGKDITRTFYAKFATLSSQQDEGFRKILYLNAVRHVLWDILNTHEYVFESAKKNISEYIDLAKVLFAKLFVLTRGHDPYAAPKDWLELPVQGMTISGGEPLLQRGQLQRLIGYVKEMRPDWDICLYSGMYSWEQMVNDPFLRSLVQMTDMVKVGAFQWKSENVAHFYFGSTNQMLLDSQQSLQHHRPVFKTYSPEIAAALQMSTWHRNNDCVPVLKDDMLDIVRMIQLGAYSFEHCEAFEAVVGAIDEGVIQRIFQFNPRRSYMSPSHKHSKKNNHLNIACVQCTPLTSAEKCCVNVYLQGSEKPPAVDSDPSLCDIGLGQELMVEYLLEHIQKMPPWYFATERKGEGLEYCRLGLALQKRLLQVQFDYFMLQSPYPDMSLREYQRIVCFYQKQIELFFTPQHAGKRMSCQTLYLRGGDPLLQTSPLAHFCQGAQQAGFEIWMELPYPLDDIRNILTSLDFMQYVDVIVCGQPHKQDFPCILPFQSSCDQRLYHADTLSPWYPQYTWSEQIMTYAQAFQKPEDIAEYTLAPSVVEYFQYNGPKVLSVEEFEHNAGALMPGWETMEKLRF